MSLLVKYPTVVSTESVSPESNNDWTTPNNVKADDAAYASITAATFDSPDISYRIKCQGFDFSAIPDGATIHGIIVEIERYCDAGETGADYRVQLLDASGALVGDNKAKAGNWLTTPTTQFYGGTEDGWNAGLTAAMVKDPDFGVVLSVSATSANADIYVDYIRMTVYYGTIDIGAAAIDRAASTNPLYTVVEASNPANATGIIDTVELWAATQLSNCEVAIFFVVSGNNLSTRDSEVLGTVVAGSKQTFTGLSMDVVSGDYIGAYWSAGTLETDVTGGVAYWYKSGDYIPCTNQTFTWYADAQDSLYGTGTEAAAGGASVNVVRQMMAKKRN